MRKMATHAALRRIDIWAREYDATNCSDGTEAPLAKEIDAMNASRTARVAAILKSQRVGRIPACSAKRRGNESGQT